MPKKSENNNSEFVLKYSDDIRHTFSTGEEEQEIARQVRHLSSPNRPYITVSYFLMFFVGYSFKTPTSSNLKITFVFPANPMGHVKIGNTNDSVRQVQLKHRLETPVLLWNTNSASRCPSSLTFIVG